jgi:UrcA family protein
MHQPTSSISVSLGIAIAAAVALSAAPSFAQPTTVGEVQVYGHIPKHDQETMSYRVGYADLDLRTEAGRKELDRRIKVAATHVCKSLGQHEHVTSASPCIDQAVTEARAKAADAKTQAFRSTTQWHAGPTWVPPEG